LRKYNSIAILSFIAVAADDDVEAAKIMDNKNS